MRYLVKIFIASILLLPAYFTNAQTSSIIKLNHGETPELFSHIAVVEVLDGRKDSLNNGFTLINKKKTKIEFENGAAYQIGNYLNTDLSERNNELLPVVIRITKLLLTERQSSKGRLAKTELTIQFLRRDHGDLIQLNETGSWMEQAITADATHLFPERTQTVIETLMDGSWELMLEGLRGAPSDLSSDAWKAWLVQFFDQDEREGIRSWNETQSGWASLA